MNACPTLVRRQFEYPLVTLFLLTFFPILNLKYQLNFVRFGIIQVDKMAIERFQIVELDRFNNFPPSPLGCVHDLK